MPQVDPYWVCGDYGPELATAQFRYPDVPKSIEILLDGVQVQTDVVSGLATAALGFALAAWVRARGAPPQVPGRWWHRSDLIAVPVAAFGAALALGFMAGAYRVGYMFEVAEGWNGTLECYIADARAHFSREYMELLQRYARWQLRAFGFGVAVGLPVLLVAGSRRHPGEVGDGGGLAG